MPACRLVGITRKTGYRWQAENGGIPSARIAGVARSNRYLSRLERQRIAILRGQGLGVREIAVGSNAIRPRSAASYAATAANPTGPTTAPWRTPGHGNSAGKAGSSPPLWPSTSGRR